MNERALRPAQGVLLMSVAMLTIPMVDGLAKHLSDRYSPFFLAWATYVVAGGLAVPTAALRAGRQAFPSSRRGLHVLRAAFLVAAMTLYYLAVARVPLATAVSAYFVGPIVAAVLSVLVLHERMTAPKTASLALGIAGALVILRPGAAVEPGVLLAFGSGVCFAVYLVVSRTVAQTSRPLQILAFQYLVGALLLTPQALTHLRAPRFEDLPLIAGMGLLSVFSHMLSIRAFQRAEASTLAPLVYLELIGATLIGLIVFGEAPGAATLTGAALIVAGGLLLLRPGRVKG